MIAPYTIHMDLSAIRDTHLDEAVAVVHCDPTYPHLPATRARALSMPASEERVCVYLFRAGETASHMTLALGVHTPESVREAWRSFLTPPIAIHHRPVFDLKSTKHPLSGTSKLLALIIDGPLSTASVDAAREWKRYDGVVDVLVDALWITHDTIMKVAASACQEVWPGITARYHLVPEAPVPVGYGDALADHLTELIRGDETFDREAYLEMRAKGDKVWRERVLPLIMQMQTTRNMIRPTYLDAQEQEDSEFDDDVLAGLQPLPAEAYSRAKEEGALPEFEAIQRQATMYAAITNPQALAAEIARLEQSEGMSSGLPFGEALAWLREQQAVSS